MHIGLYGAGDGGMGGWEGRGKHGDANGLFQAVKISLQHNHSFQFKGLWGGEMKQGGKKNVIYNMSVE